MLESRYLIDRKERHLANINLKSILMHIVNMILTFGIQNLEPLMAYEMVLGEENYDSVANTIIMSSTDSWFLRRWYWEYRNFDDSVWSHHSCFVPWSLWHVFPDSIHVVLDTMLRFVKSLLFFSTSGSSSAVSLRPRP